jgi:hypothetical protein
MFSCKIQIQENIDTGYWMLDAGCWMCGYWVLGFGSWEFEIRNYYNFGNLVDPGLERR